MSEAAKNFDEKARGEFARIGTTRVHRGELLRHPVYTRFLHWSVAIFFILSLLTGFAVYSPWLFHWITPIFGGGPRTRLLHPWFGLLFSIFFFFQFLNWVAPMAWREADRRWMKRLRQYATNEDRVESEDVGFFNGGQKLYFWAIVVSGILFLITGLLLWFETRCHSSPAADRNSKRRSIMVRSSRMVAAVDTRNAARRLPQGGKKSSRSREVAVGPLLLRCNRSRRARARSLP